MDIVRVNEVHVEALNHQARAALGSATIGVSGGGRSMVHLVDANAEALAQAVLDAQETLILECADDLIMADGVEVATVTYASAESMDYLVIYQNDIVASGTESPVDGVVSVELSADTAGVYRVYLCKKSGDFATGYVAITAV